MQHSSLPGGEALGVRQLAAALQGAFGAKNKNTAALNETTMMPGVFLHDS
jgi:hypothetical protein